MSRSERLDNARLAALRHFAHEAAEQTGKRPGWARWCFGGSKPWTREDANALIADGLLDSQDEFMDLWLRPTAEGWKVLANA